MGVRFYDKENMSTGEDYSSSNASTRTRTNCNCNTCNSQTRTTTTNATQTSCSSANGINLNYQKSGILREIIGNCKEMRIEENVHNLRIVGNNNRIRITFNVGDITIIGNSTRLKIKTNHGHIKYTGNDGRICLGKDSSEQLVDYSGCNGVLKVENSKKSSQNNDATDNANTEAKNKTSLGNTSKNGKLNSNKKPNVKYASYSGAPTESECHSDYNNIFKRKKSMPNMTATTTTTSPPTTSPFSENVDKKCNTQPARSIVHNFGNIVIANSSNVCITPYTYTY